MAKKTGEELELDLITIKRFITKNYVYIFLVLFLILGFYLRIYHINFPAIGYHNINI